MSYQQQWNRLQLARAQIAQLPPNEKQAAYQQLVNWERYNCTKYYNAFFRSAWSVIEPSTPLIWNWHIDYLCQELQDQAVRIALRQPRKHHIIINISPSSLKSSIVSRLYQPWCWTKWPSFRFLTASYSDDLAVEHAVHSRRIIQSQWYQGYWGNMFKLSGDQNLKTFYENDKYGFRVAASVGGTITGRHGNIIVIDDPLNAKEATSEAALKEVIGWWTGTMQSRLNNQDVDLFIIIMQRLHELDLTGHILTYQGKQYKHICIPAEETPAINPPELRKFYINGLFFPKNFSRMTLDRLKSTDSESYSGQYLQNPNPLEGGMFKKQWWRFWKPSGSDLPNPSIKLPDGDVKTCRCIDLPQQFDDCLASWDATFKATKDSDYVVGQVWAAKGADRFLLTQDRAKRDYPDTCRAIQQLLTDYPKISGTLIEDKANGSAILADLQKTIPGLIPCTPTVSKQARAAPYARQCESGNIYLPHPAIADWVPGYIERHAQFPKAAYDDEIDAASQVIEKFTALKRIFSGYRGESHSISVQWDNLDETTELILSLWLETDLSCAATMQAWNSRTGKLCIFGEAQYPQLRPDLLLVDLSYRFRVITNGIYNNMRQFRWLANKEAFSGSPQGDIKDAFSKIRVDLQENPKYQETGSIVLLQQLIYRSQPKQPVNEHRLLISDTCPELIRQLQAWAYDNNKPQTGYALARTALNTVSDLYEQGKYTQPARAQTPYSPIRHRTIQNAQQGYAPGRYADNQVHSASFVV